ncbi:MAG: response regulator [Rhodocyclaceae bacterium]|nr:response regulator [Rhodocyclaceae bacterium]
MNASDKATILIVDDIPENLDVLGAILRPRYRVLCATGGSQAITIASKQLPDLVMLDVMMPDMDGYETCRRLKSDLRTRAIPLIFVTAMTDARDEERGLELGAVDYLHKPCAPAIVLNRVRIHLALHRQNLALEQKVAARTRELEQTRLEIVRRLGRAAEYRDNETGMHVIRMSKSAHLLALAAGVPEAEAELLLQAAPMHDVGKIGIPDAILLKPGKLDPVEWEIMQRHPLIGAEIIGQDGSPLLEMARVVALCHHEKWNGQGYPNRLAGEAIPLEARIVTIADVFDALTSVRPYKKAWLPEDAAAFIEREAGASFDPHLVRLFIDLLPQVEEIRRQFADVPENDLDALAPL